MRACRCGTLAIRFRREFIPGSPPWGRTGVRRRHHGPRSTHVSARYRNALGATTFGTATQKGVCTTLACWEAVSRPKQALNDLHHHGDSTNDRVAGAEVTNDHDLRTGAGRSCTSRRVRSLFALVESTESAGGFAIPITVDPSIILSGSGALGPVRDVARVITVATRNCVVIGAWAGRLGEGVAVHQPDAGDLGQQGCVHGCESPSFGDRAGAGALGGG